MRGNKNRSATYRTLYEQPYIGNFVFSHNKAQRFYVFKWLPFFQRIFTQLFLCMAVTHRRIWFIRWPFMQCISIEYTSDALWLRFYACEANLVYSFVSQPALLIALSEFYSADMCMWTCQVHFWHFRSRRPFARTKIAITEMATRETATHTKILVM